MCKNSLPLKWLIIISNTYQQYILGFHTINSTYEYITDGYGERMTSRDVYTLSLESLKILPYMAKKLYSCN